MLACLACILALQVPVDQPPRLRTVFQNGAVSIVERMPGAKTIAVQLFASSRGTEETPISNGLRHLLEQIRVRALQVRLTPELQEAIQILLVVE